MPQRIRPSELPALLQPGMTVYIPGSSGESRVAVDALQSAPEKCRGVHFVSSCIPGINLVDYAGLHASASATTFFPVTARASAETAARRRCLPLPCSEIERYLRSRIEIDAVIVHLTRPDAAGQCTLGVAAEFTPTVISSAKTIIGCVNSRMPAASTSPAVSWNRLDYVVEADGPLITYDTGTPARILKDIACKAAAIVESDSVIQCGFGKAQAAVIEALANHRGLSFFSGFIGDSVVALAESGALDPGRPQIAGVAVGTESFYGFLREHGIFEFAPVSVTHDVCRMASLPRFTAINSALEIDLFGQVNAETIGARQVSAVGGLADYVRGACGSRDGKSIFAMPATAGDGKASRIVASLQPGVVTTIPRSDVDYVVTEYGAARLTDRSVDERAEALIGIAAPDFRASLAGAWEKIRASL